MAPKKHYSPVDIAEYYDKTEVHYRRGWDLSHSLAMHYGYWDEKTKDFRHSLHRMNETLASFGGLSAGERVLDAGCGVGGSSIFLAKEVGCHLVGISLSNQQIQRAEENARQLGVSSRTHFMKADYRATPFAPDSFDVIWALESAVHDPEKHDFFSEASRILRPGGRLIMGEYIKADQPMKPQDKRLFHKWLDAWAISDLTTLSQLISVAATYGLAPLAVKEITPHIRKSSWRMYYGSFFLGLLSGGYRLYNPKVSYFADNHYKGLRYQYPALRKQLWQYYFVSLVKK